MGEDRLFSVYPQASLLLDIFSAHPTKVKLRLKNQSNIIVITIMDTLKILLLLLLTANTTIAGNIRDHTRPKFSNNTIYKLGYA